MGSGHGRIKIAHGTGLLSTCRFDDLHSTKKDLAMGFFVKKAYKKSDDDSLFAFCHHSFVVIKSLCINVLYGYFISIK